MMMINSIISLVILFICRMIEEVEGETEHLSRLQADVQVNIERGATAIYDILQRLKPTKRQVEEDLKFDTNPTSG